MQLSQCIFCGKRSWLPDRSGAFKNTGFRGMPGIKQQQSEHLGYVHCHLLAICISLLCPCRLGSVHSHSSGWPSLDRSREKLPRTHACLKIAYTCEHCLLIAKPHLHYTQHHMHHGTAHVVLHVATHETPCSWRRFIAALTGLVKALKNVTPWPRSWALRLDISQSFPRYQSLRANVLVATRA